MSFNAPLLLLIPFLTLLELTQTTLYFPALNLKLTYNKTVLSNFSDMVKYQVDGANVVETYENGIFNHIYLTQNKTYQNTYFNLSDQNSSLPNDTLVDYDFQGNNLHFLLASEQISVISPENQKETLRINITEINIFNNSLLQTTNQSYYIINPSSQNQTATIYKYFRQGKINQSKVLHNALKYSTNATFSDFQNILQAFSGIKGQNIRAKVCRKWFSYDDFLVVWNEYSHIQVWTCDYWDCRKQWSVQNDITNDSWVTGNINWGSGCNKLYVEYDGYQSAMAYDELTGKIVRNYPISQTIFDFQPMGSSSDSFGGLLLSNNTFLLLTTKGLIQKVYTDFGEVTPESRFSQSTRRVLLNYENLVKAFKFECWAMTYFNYWRGMCEDCSETCDGCNEDNGKCIKCVEGLVKNVSNEKQCILPESINQTLVENPQFEPSLNNTTNQNNTSLTQAHQSNTQTQTRAFGAHYSYEQIVAQTAVQSFDFIGRIVSVLFQIIGIVPLAWLFLSFMNFWSICSYYLFLNAQIPSYLSTILKIIYQKINSPIIDLNQLSKRIYPLSQKLTQLNHDYDISSSFLTMNLENLVFLLGCFVLLKTFSFAINYTSQTNWLRQKFHKSIKIKEIIASQFISIASSFILPFSLLSTNLNFSSFAQIPNILLHVSFIAFSLIFPFIVIEKTKKIYTLKSTIFTKRQLSEIFKKRQSQKSKKFQTIEWIYVSNCNTVLPLLSVLGIPGIFYFFGFGYFLMGTWLSRKIIRLNTNDLILTFHPLLFHIFYTIVAVFGQQNVFIQHNGAMICTIILMMGAIHELLTTVWRAASFLRKQITKICSRQKKTAEQILQQNKIEKNERSVKKLEKKINFKLSILECSNEERKKSFITIQKKFSTGCNLKEQKNTDFVFSALSKKSSEYFNGEIEQQSGKYLPNHNQVLKNESTNLTEVMQSLCHRNEKKSMTYKKIKAHKTRVKKETFNCIEVQNLPCAIESLRSL